MEKRALIAVILSLAVLISYQYLFAPSQPNQIKDTKPSKEVAARDSSNARPQRAQTAEKQPEQTLAPPKTSFSPIISEGQSKDVIVSTDLYAATFTTAGARIKSWELRNYLDDDQKHPIDMARNGGSFEFAPEEHLEAFRQLIYTADRDGLTLTGSQPEESLTFSADVGDGLRVEKQFTFRNGYYDAAFRLSVTNTGTGGLKSSFELLWEHLYSKKQLDEGYAFVGPAVYIDGKRQEIKPADIKPQKDFSGGVGWVSFEDKYFITGIIPTDKNTRDIRLKRLSDQKFSAALIYPDVEIGPGQSISYAGDLYVGPKLAETLAVAPNDFRKALSYGWFDMVARPLVIVLNWFEQYTHNWGIAIILLTIVIKIAFYPLTHKSYKSMKEMQKIQPKMAKLREKFGNDKEKLNREMWHLYKTHKVSPLGGCLPMILQIPVFFALYQALLYSIELRHSPFIPTLPLLGYTWIADLSGKDPLYITPLIMGASMFIQQKMTPTTADPAQAKIMLLMPVVFTVMFLNFPSGLVIYWLVNNILSIGQQYYINKYTS